MSTTRLFATTMTMSALLALSACGGGGGGGSSSAPPPPVQNQSVGGIWRASYVVASGANAGDTVNEIYAITEAGEAFGFSRNLNTGCAGIIFGQLSVTNGNSVSGSGQFGTLQYTSIPGTIAGCVYPDNTSAGTGTVTGTVSARSTLSLTASGTTTGGLALPATTIDLSFDSTYLTPASLSTLAGNYTDAFTGATLSVSGNGTIFEQDANGCVINGTASIPNASYNLFTISATQSNCPASSLNNIALSGLAVVDTSSSPYQLIFGLKANGTGIVPTLVGSFPKQ